MSARYRIRSEVEVPGRRANRATCGFEPVLLLPDDEPLAALLRSDNGHWEGPKLQLVG